MTTRNHPAQSDARRSEDTGWFGASVRFAFGATLGLVVGFWVATSLSVNDITAFSLLLIAAAVGAGLLSARFGIRFWEGLRHLGWFVP